MLLPLYVATALQGVVNLKYAPSPADNPLKGLVPYQQQTESGFPCSMEFNYLPMSSVVKGEGKYDWTAIEELLNDVASRRRQTVFRIYLEYPGVENVIPEYLVKGGLKVHKYLNTNTQPLPPSKVETPDYEDPKLRKCMTELIASMGKRYDGDPRVGYITAGILGTWGEWHNYPRDELFASRKVQAEVLDAFQSAFKVTPVLLRYPRGNSEKQYEQNSNRPLGYHDDSFAWATLPTGKADDSWYFLTAMAAAGSEALNKWKKHPIGGEIRPEAWGKVFDPKPDDPQIQNFAKCVQGTHVSWLMDSGMFPKKQSAARIKEAVAQIQKMGYDFYVSKVSSNRVASELQVNLTIDNLGVAPFYAPWKLEFGLADDKGQLRHRWLSKTDLRSIMPGVGNRSVGLSVSEVAKGNYKLLMRVVNPLKNGLPLRFANATQNQTVEGWLTLMDYRH
jgi:hypothetical protein